MTERWNLQGIGMTSQRTRTRMVQRLRDQGIRNEELLEKMAALPRHIFVDDALAHRVYDDIALPIGFSQTISQPMMAAMMTERLLALPERPKKVLEIGTGSGYQTALLAQLFDQVFTIERIGSFQLRVRERFDALKLGNIQLHHGDGFLGWPEQAPFDAILVTAAPVTVPRTLIEQLKPDGCLILPVGEEGKQQLLQVKNTVQGLQTEVLADVRFVPLLEGKV